MDIAMDSQWNHEAGNFAMDNNNDYEKAFESYISDVDDDDEGKVNRQFPTYFLFKRKKIAFKKIRWIAFGCHEINYPLVMCIAFIELTQLHTTKYITMSDWLTQWSMIVW